MARCAASAALAYRRTLRLQIGEGGVARALERGGEAGGLRVVVPVGRLVGDVDRVVAGVDLAQFGREERRECLVGGPRAARGGGGVAGPRPPRWPRGCAPPRAPARPEPADRSVSWRTTSAAPAAPSATTSRITELMNNAVPRRPSRRSPRPAGSGRSLGSRTGVGAVMRRRTGSRSRRGRRQVPRPA